MVLLANSQIKKQYIELRKMFEDDRAFFDLYLDNQKYCELKDTIKYLEEYEYLNLINFIDKTKSNYRGKVTIIRNQRFDNFLIDFKKVEKENNRLVKKLWIITIASFMITVFSIMSSVLYLLKK